MVPLDIGVGVNLLLRMLSRAPAGIRTRGLQLTRVMDLRLSPYKADALTARLRGLNVPIVHVVTSETKY